MYIYMYAYHIYNNLRLWNISFVTTAVESEVICGCWVQNPDDSNRMNRFREGYLHFHSLSLENKKKSNTNIYVEFCSIFIYFQSIYWIYHVYNQWSSPSVPAPAPGPAKSEDPSAVTWHGESNSCWGKSSIPRDPSTFLGSGTGAGAGTLGDDHWL